ncbi:MAG: flagellar basal body P-ring formation chaperone FlgA [Planctomycetaceae bacterium]
MTRFFKNLRIPVATALLSVVCSSSLCAAVIQFKPKVVVSGNVITLGDVATVLDANAATVEKLNKTVIAPAPAAGGQVRIEFADIRSRLLATGANLAEAEFRGANSVLVQTAGSLRSETMSRNSGATFKIQRERAEKLVAAAIRASFAKIDAASGALAVVAKVDEKDVQQLLPALSAHQVEIIGGNPKTTEEQSLTVRFPDRKGNAIETSVRCRVSPHPQILAARYTIPSGHILREVDLVWRQAESIDGVAIRLEDALNRETRRIIRQDDPIRIADIQAVPLIRANDIVTVISRRGRVAIRGEMKSRTEGSMGETVTLTSLKGQDAVLARVTGLHEAEVISADDRPTDTFQDSTGRIEFRGDEKQ